MRRCAGLAVLLLCSGPLLSAQEGDKELIDLIDLLRTPIDVSASRPTTIFNAPSTVSILDRETLERFGVQSVAEAVELVSGMVINHPLWNRDIPTSRGVLQESYANRLLLLVNGVTSWNVLTGDLNLARVDIEDVERIEILKGPASVLYGTNAYAGAINIVLRQEEKRRTRVHGGYRDQGGYRAGFGHHETFGGFKLLLSAHGLREYGETRLIGSDASPAQDFVMADQNQTRNANLLLTGRGLTIQANAFVQEATWHGAANTWHTGGGSLWENTGHFLHLAYQYSPKDTLRLRYAGTYDVSGKESPISLNHATYGPRSVGLRQRGHRTVHVLSGDWDVTKKLHVEVGGTMEDRVNDYYERYLNTTGQTIHENNLADRSVGENSLYAQAGFSAGRWSLLLGARTTDNELAGSNTSTRGTVVYQLADRHALKLIYGQSFRAPAFLEQYIDFGTVLGNPALRPERSDSVEVAYVGAFGDVFVQALGYHSTYDDKAYRAIHPTIAGARVYDNAPEFGAYGAELELRYSNPKLVSGFLQLDYIDGNNGDQLDPSVVVGYNYRMVPRWTASLGVNRSVKNVTAAALVNHTAGNDGPRGPVDPSGKTWDTVPSWTSFDVTLAYVHKLGKVSLRHSAGVRNAFDDERWHAENTRRTVNRIPDLKGRLGFYNVTVEF